MNQPTTDPLFILYPYNAPTDGTDWGFYPLSYWHPSMPGIVGAFSPDDIHAPVSNIDEAVVDAALDVYMPMAEVSLDTWCHWMYNVKKAKLTIHDSQEGVPDVIYHGVQGALSSRDADPFHISSFTEFSQYPVPDAMQYPEGKSAVAAGGIKVYWWKQDGSTSEGTSRGPDWLQFVHRGTPYIGLQYQSSIVSDSTATADYNSVVVSLDLGSYTLTYTYEVEATFY